MTTPKKTMEQAAASAEKAKKTAETGKELLKMQGSFEKMIDELSLFLEAFTPMLGAFGQDSIITELKEKVEGVKEHLHGVKLTGYLLKRKATLSTMKSVEDLKKKAIKPYKLFNLGLKASSFKEGATLQFFHNISKSAPSFYDKLQVSDLLPPKVEGLKVEGKDYAKQGSDFIDKDGTKLTVGELEEFTIIKKPIFANTQSTTEKPESVKKPEEAHHHNHNHDHGHNHASHATRAVPAAAAGMPLLKRRKKLGLTMGFMKPDEVAKYESKKPKKIKGSSYTYPMPNSKEVKSSGYAADSGLDIYAPEGTPVFSIGSGTIVYSERGHTPWGTTKMVGIDTPYSMLVKLDKPLTKNGQVLKTSNGQPVQYIWYTHMLKLKYHVKNGEKRIEDGELVGLSGTGNKVPHLHLGLLSHRSQKAGTFLKMGAVNRFLNLKGGQTFDKA